MKLKKGDNVVVISGKDRGKTGPILRVIPDSQRVVVTGVNVQKKHVKPVGNNPGGIVEREGAIHSSNVMMICPKTKKRTRVGYTVDEKTQRRVRVSKKSNEALDGVKTVKAPTKEKSDTKKTSTKK